MIRVTTAAHTKIKHPLKELTKKRIMYITVYTYSNVIL